MKITSALFLSLLLTAFQPAAHAAVSTNYVWNDMTGVQPVQGCNVTHSKQSLPDIFNKYIDQVVEIIDAPTMTHASAETADLRGSYLQIATKDGLPQVMNCAGLAQTFVVFDVYSASESNSFWQIGLSAADLEIFHHSQVLAPEQIEDIYHSATAAPIQEKAVAASTTEQVYCLASSQNNVYAANLSSVLFKINAHEVVQPVQSFDGSHQKNKTINGKPIAFIKILVPRLKAGQNIGWVAKHLVKTASTCATYKPTVPPAPKPPTTPQWTFPTIKRATTSYKSGMRAFKASRGGGKRWHAACDIYRVKDESAVSVHNGTVVRGLYFFYEGTYALEVRHSDGKIARYGELTSKVATGVKQGAAVKTNQVLGYIGKVNSGCCQPMLHFELYSGKATGSLTQSGNKFSRRSDLIDPSSYLTDWEKAKFGVAY